MDKTTIWLVRVIALFIISGWLFAYLNFQRKPTLLLSKASIENLRYKELDKKLANTEFAAQGYTLDYENFGSIIFCNASLNSWIESVNYSKQIDLYIFWKDTDLSKWDYPIKDYENKRSQFKDFNP